MVSNKKRLIIEELVQGKEFASQLQILFQKHSENGCRRRFSDATTSSAEELVQNILTCFNVTLSSLMITSVGSATCNDDDDNQRLKEYCRQNRKRTAPKDKRGCYKRKKDVQTYTVVSSTVEDGHAWRKYGQKEILNSIHPRSYFRCTRKYEQGCKAMKQVQRTEDDPQMYQITYIGTHTCTTTIDSFKSNPQIITFKGSDVNDPIAATPTVKQESKEEITTTTTTIATTTTKNDVTEMDSMMQESKEEITMTTTTIATTTKNDVTEMDSMMQESKEEITTTTTTATTTTTNYVREMDSMIIWKDIIGGGDNEMGSDYGYPCSEITSHNLELEFGMIKPMVFENYLKFYESECPI